MMANLLCRDICDYTAEVTWPDHAALLDRMLYRRSNIINYSVHTAQIAKHYKADVTWPNYSAE